MIKVSLLFFILPITIITSPVGISELPDFQEQHQDDHTLQVKSIFQTNKSLSSWFRKLFLRTADNTNNRGVFCSIFPHYDAPDMLTIWTTEPLFIWQANNNIIVQTIEVINFSTNSIIWEHEIKEEEQRRQMVRYGGQPLMSGSYTYKISYQLGENTPDISEKIDFEVMNEEKRSQIEENLPTTNPKLNLEKLAIQRADYFANKKLGADAINEVFSVTNPSPEWQQGLQELRTSFCGSSQLQS